MDEKEKEEMTAAQSELQADALRSAHMVVMIVTNSEDVKLYNVFQSDLIIIDESARLLKADAWNILGSYRRVPTIFVDDENQLRPTVSQRRRAVSHNCPLS